MTYIIAALLIFALLVLLKNVIVGVCKFVLFAVLAGATAFLLFKYFG
jgi:hypothetical protein